MDGLEEVETNKYHLAVQQILAKKLVKFRNISVATGFVKIQSDGGHKE